tara:strand:- start:79 stop:426 length:348 start_codon:yes stop_codon:yes gene_type:complete
MRILNILVFFLLINSTSLALETKRILDHDEWTKKMVTLDWKNLDEEQEYRTDIEGVNASIKINKEDFYLINKEELMRFMTLNVVKNDFLEAKGHWYYGLYYEKTRKNACLYRIGR